MEKAWDKKSITICSKTEPFIFLENWSNSTSWHKEKFLEGREVQPEKKANSVCFSDFLGKGAFLGLRNCCLKVSGIENTIMHVFDFFSKKKYHYSKLLLQSGCIISAGRGKDQKQFRLFSVRHNSHGHVIECWWGRISKWGLERCFKRSVSVSRGLITFWTKKCCVENFCWKKLKKKFLVKKNYVRK